MSKQIVCIDIETTGLDKKIDRIIQFAALKFDSETYETLGELNYRILPDGIWKMGLGAYIKHGIKPDDLMGCPCFSDIAQEILDFISGCAVLTFNGIMCDVPFMQMEFARCGIAWDPKTVDQYDAMREERRRNPGTLGGVYKRLIGESMEDSGLTAHDAMADVKATVAVFKKQNESGEVLPEELICSDGFLQKDERGVITFASGKYKDVPVVWVKKADPDYMMWCLSDRCTAAPDAKEILRKYIL